MADSTTGEVNKMLSGELPLVDASGNVLSPAKTTTGPTPNSVLDAATIVRGRNGEIIMGGSLVKNPNPNTDVQSARIGDYVYDVKGNPQVVPNSYRDLVNQYVVREGQSAYKGLGVYDYATAVSKGLSAFFGAPTDSSSLGSTLRTMTAGQIAKANPTARSIWAVLNTMNSLVEAEASARDKFLNQEIDYDIALDFSTDKEGNVVATPNYKKMETAGVGSGSRVEDLTNTDKTSVSMAKDNQLDINVSKTFADSADFASMLDFIRDQYGSLTKAQSDEVVDEDTGQTRLQVIEQDIKAAEQRFYYNAKSIQAFKEIAPNASEEALDQASFTQLAGYVAPETLEKISITIYDEQNEKQEVNAKDYLDSIASKSKKDRNAYMNSLGSRIQSEEISDDERVILQAQANALYAASNNDGAYNGMYKKGFFDSLGDAPVPVFNKISLGELFAEPFGYTSLDTFETNEWFAGLFQIGATVAEIAAVSGVANGAEDLLRGGIERLGTGALSGTKLGSALGKINAYAPQDVAVYANEALVPAAVKTGRVGTKYIVADNVADYIGRTTVQNGMQVAADAVIEGLRYGYYTARGKEDRFNFLDEFQTDLLIDALMTYGPRNYVTKTEAPKIKVFDAEEKIEEVDEEGRPTGEVSILPGVRMVEVDADEVAKKHAERIDKLTDSDLALKTQEILFDRNAAFGKMAVEIRQNVSGDNYLYRKTLRMGNDIRSLTQDVHSKFNQIYNIDLNNFMSKLSEVVPKIRNWTQADRDYLNAAAQSYRFSKIHEGDEQAQKEIKSFYSKALNGVPKERKVQLNELLAYGRILAADVLDFYKENDIISEQAKKEIESKPEYVGKMFFPVWQKGKRISGNEEALFVARSMERPALKSVFNKEELIAVEDLEDPLVTLSQYLQNAARNVAINERALTIREATSIPGMKMRLVTDTGGELKNVENLKELNDNFAKKYDAIVKKTRKEYPTMEQWQVKNDNLVLSSQGLKIAQELEELQKKAQTLNKELRSERKKSSGKSAQGVTSKAQKVFDLETEIAANKQAQLYAIDRIKDSVEPLMRKAQKMSKSDASLDIESYLNIQVTNSLKKALKSNSSTAQIQLILSDAVEKANPFVDPDVLIQTRAEEAAVKYRKEIAKKIATKDKTTVDELNLIADKVMDSIEEKVMGTKPGLRVIDDAEATRILNNSGDSHTIRYLLDGVEQRMVLAGPGTERLVAEFYQPEGWQPTSFWGVLLNNTINTTGKIATAKRVLTSSMDIGKVLPNLARDWSRGIVTTGGSVLLSPSMIRDWALSQGEASPERAKIVDDGLTLVRESIDRSTLTESLEAPKKNRAKSMIRAANEPDGNGFTKFVYNRAESPVKALSTLQDMGETFTRTRAMEVAYYRALGDYFSRGLEESEAVKRATEAAYIAGREATVNYFRRGKLIAAIARNVPYFSQNFASLESFKYAFLDNPLAVTRALQDTTFAYTALIAIALSNDESRKKYFLLTEYDRANNIIIPLANDAIITIPLDENMAAFLTPWRRTVESLAGVDPEAFYMIFLETFEALNPFDLEGFSEGDKFNLVRGLEKLGSQMIPTWAQPLIEAYTGRDLYYGSTLKVSQDDIGQQTGNWSATPGQLTTKSKNSKALAEVSEHTGIPQWILQNMLSEYGGNIGQYALNVIDKLSGATEEAQGGKEWSDSIFKPFTGSDSNQVNQAFWDGVNQLKEEKKTLQRELKTIKNQITAATGEEKANLQQKRQEKINAYGTRVSDFLSQYLSAYEITGGLSKSQANQVWYLYKIYDDDANANMYDVLSTGEYYSNKQDVYNNRRATGLAAASGIDNFIDPNVAKADNLARSASDPASNYADSYGRQAHLNSIYGDATKNVYRIETALKNSNLLGNKMWEGYNEAKAQGKTALKKYKTDWNTQVLLAIAPTVEEVGLDAILNSNTLDYLDNYLFDVTTFNRKEYIKKAFGG